MRLVLSVIGLALATIRENKVRSLLTVLGVVIGTSTIIAVGSIMAGIDGTVTGVIRSFGTNTVLVTRQGAFGGTRTAEERQRKPITFEQAKAIEERSPSVEYVSPILQPGGGILRARYKGNEMLQVQFRGTDDHYGDTGSVDLREGRFFTETENKRRVMVAILGADATRACSAANLRSTRSSRSLAQQFEVIGVMNKPATALPGQSDNQIIIPYFVMRKMYPNQRDHVLMVKAREGLLAKATDEARVVLRQERRDGYSAPDSFSMSTSTSLSSSSVRSRRAVAVGLVVLEFDRPI